MRALAEIAQIATARAPSSARDLSSTDGGRVLQRRRDDADDDDLLALCAAATVPAGDPRRRCVDGLCVARSSLPEPHAFWSEHVAPSLPAVFTGCISHWPALERWSNAYLRETLRNTACHVALTPDGLADAVVDGVFVKPLEARLPFSALLEALETPLYSATGAARRAVHYCSHQDSSLTAELAPLVGDVEASLGWADAAFGRPPSAVNFWMGEDAARTTVHADLYDNLYAVVRGTKVFTLLPPQEGASLRRRPYRSATYARDDDGGEGASGLRLVADEPRTTVHWASVDLECDEGAALRPIIATVRAGEVLYLPALWWHAVSQRGDDGGATVAVNYWYRAAALGDDVAAAADSVKVLASAR